MWIKNGDRNKHWVKEDSSIPERRSLETLWLVKWGCAWCCRIQLKDKMGWLGKRKLQEHRTRKPTNNAKTHLKAQVSALPDRHERLDTARRRHGVERQSSMAAGRLSKS
jgi:hypothetical protein